MKTNPMLLAFSLAVSLILSVQSVAAETVNIYSYRQPFLINPILDKFTEETGIKTKMVYAKKGLMERLEREGKLSPADVVLTSNFAILLKMVDKGLTQSIKSDVVEKNIPEQFIDDNKQWVALTLRARNVYSSKERVGKLDDIRYEDLADKKYKGKICTRSGKHPYNLALIASMIAHHGEKKTEAWLKGVKANLARRPQGNDRAQVKAVKEGVCDLALGNSYYYGKMLKNEKQKAWADSVYINFPNKNDRGTHVNVSAAIITKHAPNKKAAVKLIEFLSGNKAQELYAELNMEYPVKTDVPASQLVKSWGTLKADQVELSEVAKHYQDALKLVDKVGYDL